MNDLDTSPVEKPSDLEMSRALAYLEKIQRQFVGSVTMRLFFDMITKWKIDPKPLGDVYNQIAALFNNNPEILDGVQYVLPGLYPRETARARAIEAARSETHKAACERQSSSPLLRLPRELRDKIWEDACVGNIIHVSPNPTSKSDQTCSKYRYHSCVSPKGLQSLACPPGIGDHINCSTTDGNSCVDLRLVCKQIYLELSDLNTNFFSQSAFQFATLRQAEDFLFGISEEQRAAITHLRLAIPHEIVQNKWTAECKSWVAINNYFSNPWDRKTLHMGPPNRSPEDSVELKAPLYFYYSSCYYQHNRYRLGHRWQVRRGNTSWDIGISDLKYKGEPRLDIAILRPTEDENEYEEDEYEEYEYEEYEYEEDEHEEDEDIDERDYGYRPDGSERYSKDPWDIQLEDPPQWLRPLLQFRQYDGLSFNMYDETGCVNTPEFDVFVKALKEYMSGPVIGPRKSIIFGGSAYHNGDFHVLRA